jgi:hypothetical protein
VLCYHHTLGTVWWELANVVRVSKLGAVMDVDVLKSMTGPGWATILLFTTGHREGDQPYLLADI